MHKKMNRFTENKCVYLNNQLIHIHYFIFLVLYTGIIRQESLFAILEKVLLKTTGFFS